MNSSTQNLNNNKNKQCVYTFAINKCATNNDLIECMGAKQA